jgi:hypothetical protein
MSPFMPLYGYHNMRGNVKVKAMEDHIENQQEVLQLLKENLAIEKNKIKQQENQHHNKRNLN